jgi:hypothetical protein
MQAYGSDRVRRGDGERVILSSHEPKGWTARVEKTLTSAEFPGTAVLWEERYFEVVRAEPVAGGVRYILEPWRDHHAMRVTDRYDEESEVLRIEEQRKARLREKHRKSANALALLTGHLPAVAQEQLGRELGILPARITLISVVGEYVVVAALLLWLVNGRITNTPRPFAAVVIFISLGFETTFRFFIAWTQSRPIGSTIGFIVYLLFNGLPATEKGFAVPIPTPSPEVQARDTLTLREPLVTLLPASDQARIAARFAYDYRRLSGPVAIFILVFAVGGVITAIRTNAVPMLIVASFLSIEQIVRLLTLRSGPAGSVFGWFVRPFVRKLL